MEGILKFIVSITFFVDMLRNNVMNYNKLIIIFDVEVILTCTHKRYPIEVNLTENYLEAKLYLFTQLQYFVFENNSTAIS